MTESVKTGLMWCPLVSHCVPRLLYACNGTQQGISVMRSNSFDPAAVAVDHLHHSSLSPTTWTRDSFNAQLNCTWYCIPASRQNARMSASWLKGSLLRCTTAGWIFANARSSFSCTMSKLLTPVET